jgi:Family of unknown function (DUF6174)
MHRSVKLVSVVLVSLFAACGDGTGPTSLGINRLRWESRNLDNYTYTARRLCFCPESGQEVFVTVISDAVFSVRLVATGAEVPTAGWHTVPQLFDLVEGAVEENYESVSVEFDPHLGYPRQIRLVCDDTTLDCGLTIEARELAPIFIVDN